MIAIKRSAKAPRLSDKLTVGWRSLVSETATDSIWGDISTSVYEWALKSLHKVKLRLSKAMISFVEPETK